MLKQLNHTNTCNQSILEFLLNAREALSEEAQNHIKSFVELKKYSSGGFTDRAGKPDLYYTVFGYTLSLVFDLKLNIREEKQYLESCKAEAQKDFVHAVCLVRAYFLIHLIDLRQKSRINSSKFLRVSFAKNLMAKELVNRTMKDCPEVLWELENYVAADEGYSHNGKNEAKSSVYANYLMWTLYQDLLIEEDTLEDILNANLELMLKNGSFANENSSTDGVTSATAAGIIMGQNLSGVSKQESLDWIHKRRTPKGGFIAADDLPIADLLSTSTALLALKLAGEDLQSYAENSLNFVNLHWDESGGFFGSVADMTCDVEYTYYALLALGVLAE